MKPGARSVGVKGKRNARLKAGVGVANLCCYEHLRVVLQRAVAKSVKEALPKICRNDKKKRCSGEHL